MARIWIALRLAVRNKTRPANYFSRIAQYLPIRGQNQHSRTNAAQLTVAKDYWPHAQLLARHSHSGNELLFHYWGPRIAAFHHPVRKAVAHRRRREKH